MMLASPRVLELSVLVDGALYYYYIIILFWAILKVRTNFIFLVPFELGLSIYIFNAVYLPAYQSVRALFTYS